MEGPSTSSNLDKLPSTSQTQIPTTPTRSHDPTNTQLTCIASVLDHAEPVDMLDEFKLVSDILLLVLKSDPFPSDLSFLVLANLAGDGALAKRSGDAVVENTDWPLL